MTTCVSKIRVNEPILQTQNNSWVTSGEELCYAKNSVQIAILQRQIRVQTLLLNAWSSMNKILTECQVIDSIYGIVLLLVDQK